MWEKTKKYVLAKAPFWGFVSLSVVVNYYAGTHRQPADVVYWLPWNVIAILVLVFVLLSENKLTPKQIAPTSAWSYIVYLAVLLFAAVGLYSVSVVIYDGAQIVARFDESVPIMFFALAAGLILFGWRTYARFWYGVTEVVVGLAVANFNYTANFDKPATNLVFAILTAGVYLIVRGLDNMKEGWKTDKLNLQLGKLFAQQARKQKEAEEEAQRRAAEAEKQKKLADEAEKRLADELNKKKQQEDARVRKQAKIAAEKEAAEQRNRDRIKQIEKPKDTQRRLEEEVSPQKRLGVSEADSLGRGVATRHNPYQTASELEIEAAMKAATGLGPIAQEIARTVMAKNSLDSAAAELAKNGIHPNSAMSAKRELDRLEAGKRDAMTAALRAFKDKSIMDFAKTISGETTAKEAYWQQYGGKSKDHEDDK